MKKSVINDKRIDLSEIKKLVLHGDAVDSVAFIMPRFYNGTDLFHYDVYLKYENNTGNGEHLLLSKTLTSDDVMTVIWEINGTFTQEQGQHKIQLWAGEIKNDIFITKWQTFPSNIEVYPALNPTFTDLEPPSIFEDYLSKYQALEIHYCIDGTRVGFRKSPNGEWEYTDDLTGDQGLQGVQGPQGIKGDTGDDGDLRNLADGTKIKMWKGTRQAYNALPPEKQLEAGVIHYIEEEDV